jgi:hypothetical protein
MPGKPRLPRQSEQVPLVAVWVAASNEGFPQGSELFRGVVAPNLRNADSGQLVAAFVIRIPKRRSPTARPGVSIT